MVLIASLNMENKLKNPNKLALLILPEVATGWFVQSVAGERHREVGSVGIENSLDSPTALNSGV